MKAVIFARVSTEAQELESQVEQLKEFASREGYTEENQILISNKESAICNTAEEREGFQELVKLIEEGSINCIYAWEVSRIGRQMIDVITIRDLCVKHKIQLKTINPSLVLLDDEGKLTSMASVVLSIMATMAEEEMKIKKARMIRGKKAKARTGKYIGGQIVYGYKVNEDGDVVINPEEAEVVRKIFRDYTTNNISVANLAKNLREMNVKTKLGSTFNKGAVTRILRAEIYKGGTAELGTVYPSIISPELFAAAEAKRTVNRLGGIERGSTGLIWYALKLLKCKKCGRNYMIMVKKREGRERKYYYKCAGFREDVDKCRNVSIQAELADSLLWDAVLFVHRYFITDPDIKNVEIDKLNTRVNELVNMITGNKEILRDIEAKNTRALKLYVEGRIDDKRLDEMTSGFNAEKKKAEDNIANYQESLNRTLEEKTKLEKDDYTTNAASLEELNQDQTEEGFKRKRELIRSYVRDCNVEEWRSEDTGKKLGVIFTINFHHQSLPKRYFLVENTHGIKVLDEFEPMTGNVLPTAGLVEYHK